MRVNTLRVHLIIYIGIFLTSVVLRSEPNIIYRPPQGYRFHKANSKIESLILSAKNLDEVVTILAKDGRGPAFALEGLAKLYDKHYPDELTSTFDFAKRLEDNIGRYVDATGHRTYATELAWKTPSGSPPNDVIAHLEQEIEEARHALEAVLIKDRWVATNERGELIPGASPRAQLIQKKIDAIEWHGPNQDRLDVLETFRKHLQKKIVDRDWDFTELQSGVHELRRRMRWPMIWLHALDGMFVGTNQSIEGLDGIKRNRSVTESPYTKLPPVSAQYPILLPKTGYYWLSNLVENLGLVKDVGEAENEWLLEALENSSYREKGAKTARDTAKILVKTHPKYVTKKSVLPSVESTLRDTELFPKMIKRLKKQESWSKSKCTRKVKELGS